MKIAVLGTGYVGLSTGVCLAEIGHTVTCIDVDEGKIEKLTQGKSPIYEPDMEDLLQKNIARSRLNFTSAHKTGFAEAEVIIIAVGTPENPDGSVNLAYLEQAARDLAAHLKQDAIIVIKSTVPVGTNEHIQTIIEEHLPQDIAISMISNPEFLREGSAIKDTLQADRILIGSRDEKAAEKIKEMYQPLKAPLLLTSIRTAEMIKYAANAFLATKISFINQIANVCETIGADVEDVALGMGMDQRIGNAFLNAGIGYGGSCFPKDVKGLIHTAAENGINLTMLQETMAINEKQQVDFVKKVKQRLDGLNGKKIAMLGLAFKPETDDIREAPALKIAAQLSASGAIITAFDPVAIANARQILGNSIKYGNSIIETVQNADAVLIITEWKEFITMDWQMILSTMKQPIIFDGRNCLDKKMLAALNQVEYYAIGRPALIKKD